MLILISILPQNYYLMYRASGACVLSTWHVKSTRCISTVKALLYRLSSCVVCLDAISQPSHLPRVHCHKGMVCQRGGEHIYIYRGPLVPPTRPKFPDSLAHPCLNLRGTACRRRPHLVRSATVLAVSVPRKRGGCSCCFPWRQS